MRKHHMKIIRFNQRKSEMKLEPENFEDLWHLMKIINEGDVVISRTIRRFQIGRASCRERV